MGKDISTAIIFVSESNEVLLQKKTLDYTGPCPGGWFVFGGAIEESETPLDALDRELKEELGVGVNFFRECSLIWSGNYKGMHDDKGTAHLFCLEQSSRNLKEYIIGEGAGIAYFNLSELKNLKMDRAIEDFLNKFMKWRDGDITDRKENTSYYNILFICKHNVFRSQIAEAYFNQRNKNSNLRARSGGLFSHPSLNYFQVQIAEELGISYRDAKSKNLTTQDLARQDLIVITADNVASDLIESNIYSGPIERWDICDVVGEDKEGVKRAIQEIKLKVDELLGRLNAR